MIRNYYSSQVGKSHIKHNVVCQDYSGTIFVNNLCISCIADGVGSAIHSDVASKMAVEGVLDYLNRWYSNNDIDEREILLRIKEAFNASLNKIKLFIQEDEKDEFEYDTTLDCVVYYKNHIYYGHSGDGGIISLDYEGKYHLITKPQKGEDGISVIPFRLSDYWEFGKVNDPMCSVLLATDGVYEQLAIGVYKCFSIGIYVRLAEILMNLNDKGFNDEALNMYKVKVFEFLSGNSSITDDITVSVIYDDEAIPAKMPEEYYALPDWNAIIEEKNNLLYGESIIEPVEDEDSKKKKKKRRLFW